MTAKLAITFGQKYHREEHPKLGALANPDGYIVIEADTIEEAYDLIPVVCGLDGGVGQWAFDYAYDQFTAPSGSAETYHPLGCLATFTLSMKPGGE